MTKPILLFLFHPVGCPHDCVFCSQGKLPVERGVTGRSHSHNTSTAPLFPEMPGWWKRHFSAAVYRHTSTAQTAFKKHLAEGLLIG